MATSLQFYGINAYEAIVNAVVADVLLALRAKKMPGLEHLLKHGAEKALINIVATIVSHYGNPGGVAPLDTEYLIAAIVAAISQYWNPGMSMTYLAGEQMLINVISHIFTTKSASAGLGYFTSLGNAGAVNVNSAVNQ